MMDKHTLAAVNVCREQIHRLVDERFDGLLCDLILGEEAEKFRAEEGRLLPFASPPSMFKGEKPASVILHGVEIEAATWKKAVLIVLRDCAANPQCHRQMMELRGRVNGNFRTLLSDHPEGMASPLKIDAGLYWESKFDTEALLGNLTVKLLEQVGYDYQDIVIRFRTPQQDMAEQAEGDHAEGFDQNHGSEMAM
jgi:hypothetical protein